MDLYCRTVLGACSTAGKDQALPGGDAGETLRELGPAERFEFAFIDADKIRYTDYFELLMPLMRAGSLLIFDNMLMHGRVVNPESEEDKAIVSLNRRLVLDPRLESVLLPLADALMICRKR